MNVRRRKETDRRVGKTNLDLRDSYRTVVTKQEVWELSTTAKQSVLNKYFADPHLWSWERVLSQVKAGDRIFSQSSRCDSSWQSALPGISWNSEYLSTSPNREISATMIRPRDQKGPGKVGVSCPAGNT